MWACLTESLIQKLVTFSHMILDTSKLSFGTFCKS